MNEIPTYGLPEAAMFLRLPYVSVRRWTQEDGLIRSGEKNLLSYTNLLELHVLKALRKHFQVPMQRIRRAIEVYGQRYDTPHPLLDKRLRTDGFSLVLQDGEAYEDLSRYGQLALPPIVARYLNRIDRHGARFEFFPFVLADRDGESEPRSVLITPEIAFGKPVLAGTGITTEVIAGRFMARDSMMDLAEEYGVSPEQIEEAVRWESPKQKHAA